MTKACLPFFKLRIVSKRTKSDFNFRAKKGTKIQTFWTKRKVKECVESYKIVPFFQNLSFPFIFETKSFPIDAQCLKITEKVSFNIASEASYVYILSGHKLIKSAKNCPFWRAFENLQLAVKQCYQTGQF